MKITIFAVISFIALMIANQSFGEERLNRLLKKYGSHKDHKALAISTFNGYSYRAYDYPSVEAAKKRALTKCRLKGRTCKIYFLNDKKIATIPRQIKLSTKVTVFEAKTNKKHSLKAKTIFDNQWKAVSAFRVITNSGNILCRGTRVLAGTSSVKIDADCLGVKYRGRIQVSAKSMKVKLKSGNSWMELLIQ